MLHNHISEIFLKNMGFLPTIGQKNLIAHLSAFISDSKNHATFLIKGFAGTGKTTMVNALVKTLAEFSIDAVLMAPTGRAAKVLSSYTGKDAFTIHKKIYRQRSSNEGFGVFAVNFNPAKNTFFIVDEASMLSNSQGDFSPFGSGKLLTDLIDFVFSGQNCKLILIGDTAQLPPVGLDISPALDIRELRYCGLDVSEAFLKDIVRQSEDSGILMNATAIRNIIDSGKVDIPILHIDGFDDVVPVTGNDLLEFINDSYDKNGVENTIVITRSNKRANQFNQGIRNKILWRESELESGDLLMVVKNNYHWMKDNREINFIANGDIIRVARVKKIYEQFGLRFADITAVFADYNDLEADMKIILDTLTSEGPSLTADENKKLYYSVLEEYADAKNKKELNEKIKSDPHFNALQVKYAYAITGHKAQGGQWDTVFLDQGYFKPEMNNTEFLRWLYTGFTRPTKKLFLVNFNACFFDSQ
ncbi:MAG: ATP-dependent endonuclease [Bacteroidetes bacterium GWF2_38_335]|nr:MAG: ATP-dependent endonuclease [Bacteroidetes bacterium GWF2_38_335]OFY79781.1 MAG: ATP-dependent endonuclease [Bacteroidetes bacterium RIFOXYA12_FULL_38_20]HBS88169.1 ATP-dependent endonuclease [Bacteroidales bacterium]